MSEELLRLLELHRELAAAGEMVDAFLGRQPDPRTRQNLVRASVEGYKAEGKSLADELATANLRVALMDKYGNGWPQSAEWKSHTQARPTSRGRGLPSP